MAKKPITLIIEYSVKLHLILAKQIQLICQTFYILNCCNKLHTEIRKLKNIQIKYSNKYYYITSSPTVAGTIIVILDIIHFLPISMLCRSYRKLSMLNNYRKWYN